MFSACDAEDQRRALDLYAGLIALLGVVACASNFGQQYLFSVAGERLTMRLRQLSFCAILKQDMQFFDRKSNSAGLLVSKLAGDASLVKGVRGESHEQNYCNAYIHSWCAMFTAPMMMACGITWKLLPILSQ